jgi:hypothetical protein
MNPAHHAYETVSILAAAIATSGAAVAITHPSGDTLTSAVLWSLLPLIGAILISGMSFLLGSVDEPRKRVFGRALGAILFGVAGPRFTLHYKPDIAVIIDDPILMIAAGAAFGLVGYAVIATVINWVMIKAPSKLENRLNNLIYENKNNIDDDSDRLVK